MTPAGSSSSRPFSEKDKHTSSLHSGDPFHKNFYVSCNQNSFTTAELDEWYNRHIVRRCMNQTCANEEFKSYIGDADSCGRICLVPVNWLKAHEQCSYDRYVKVFLDIVKAMGYEWPIIVDYCTGVILDGHHRFQVALALHLERIPAILVNYLVDDTIQVVPWRNSDDPLYTAEQSSNDFFESQSANTKCSTIKDAPLDQTTRLSEYVDSTTDSNRNMHSDVSQQYCALSSSITASCNRKVCSHEPLALKTTEVVCVQSLESSCQLQTVDLLNHCSLEHLSTPSEFCCKCLIATQRKATTEALLKRLIQYNIKYFTLDHRRRFRNFFAFNNSVMVDSLARNSLYSSQNTSEANEKSSTQDTCSPFIREKNFAVQPSAITKLQVVMTGLSSKLFPPKTTRHLFPPHMSINNSFVALYLLFKKSYSTE